ANPFGELPVTPIMASGSNAGIITVNGLTSVPEPGSAVFGGLLLAGVFAWQRRRRLSGTPAAKQ
ncbi:MAG: PEP-CTERM sorting domain-containing protein, partial [Planctomyces sp.]